MFAPLYEEHGADLGDAGGVCEDGQEVGLRGPGTQLHPRQVLVRVQGHQLQHRRLPPVPDHLEPGHAALGRRVVVINPPHLI